MYKLIKVSQIRPDSSQPRIEFDTLKLARLKNSIKKQGIINPLVVEKTDKSSEYLLVDGERRYRSAKDLKLEEVPATIIDKMDSKQRLAKRFHLQEMHSGWTMSEKAKAVIDLMNNFNMSNAEICDLLGIPSSSISSYSAIKELNPRLSEIMENKRISMTGLANCGYLIRKAGEKDKQKLQKALTDKINRGVVTSSKDYTIYNRCACHDRDVIRKIISDPNYSAQKALEQTGKDAIYACNSARTGLHYLRKALERIYDRGDHFSFNRFPSGMRDMKHIHEIIERIAKDIRLNL